MKRKNLIYAVMLLLSNALLTSSFAAPVHEEPVPLKQKFIYQPGPPCAPVLYLDNLPGYAVSRIGVNVTDPGGVTTYYSFNFTRANQPTYPYQLPSPISGNYSVNVFYIDQAGATGSLYVIDSSPGQGGSQVACRSLTGSHSLPVSWQATCNTYTVTISDSDCQ